MEIKHISEILKKQLPFIYRKYMANIWFDRSKNVFRGVVSGINEDISFEGRSIEELNNEFKLRIDTYLLECEKNEVEPEKQFTGEILIKTHPNLMSRLTLLCEQLNISLDKFIEDTMYNSLRNLEWMTWGTNLVEVLDEQHEENLLFNVEAFEYPLFYKGHGAVMYLNDDKVSYKGFLLRQKPRGITFCFTGKTQEEAVTNFKHCVDNIIKQNELNGNNDVPFNGEFIIKTDPRIQYLISLLAHLFEKDENKLLAEMISNYIKTEYDGYSFFEPEVLTSMIVPKNKDNNGACKV